MSRSSIDLDWRTVIQVLVLQNGLSTEYELGSQATCFAMNFHLPVEIWCVGRCPELFEPSRHSCVILFTWRSKQYGTSCLFILWAGKGIKSTSCVPVCHQKTRGYGTRGTQRLGSHHHVQLSSNILPSRSPLRRELHLFPRWQRGLRGC